MYCALCRFSMNLKCRQHTCTFVSDSLISSLIRAGLHPHPRNFKEFAVETFTLYQAWTHHIRWEWECVYHFLYILPCEYLEFLHRASLSMQSLHPEVRENIQRRQPDIWCMSVCYLVPVWPGFFWQYQHNFCSPPGSFIRFGCLQLCLHSKNKNQGEVLTDWSTSTANHSGTSATVQNWSSSEKSKIAEVDVGQL